MKIRLSGHTRSGRKSLDRMLGLAAGFDELIIDPIIPSQWEKYEVVKVFRGCRVHAHFHNPEGRNRGVARVSLDGEPLAVKQKKASIPVERLHGLESANLKVMLG